MKFLSISCIILLNHVLTIWSIHLDDVHSKQQPIGIHRDDVVGEPMMVRFEDQMNNGVKPVEITVYLEALCPFCVLFVHDQLFPTFERLRRTGILKVRLYAYGNAEETWNGVKWVYKCQHGQRECNLNLLLTCAFSKLNDAQKVPFLHCMETRLRVHDGKKCLKEVGADWRAIYKCYYGNEGNRLQHEVGKIQNSLRPPKKFVPWILVDGYHSDDWYEHIKHDMLSFVCKVYKGVKPNECLTLKKEGMN